MVNAGCRSGCDGLNEGVMVIEECSRHGRTGVWADMLGEEAKMYRFEIHTRELRVI